MCLIFAAFFVFVMYFSVACCVTFHIFCFSWFGSFAIFEQRCSYREYSIIFFEVFCICFSADCWFI